MSALLSTKTELSKEETKKAARELIHSSSATSSQVLPLISSVDTLPREDSYFSVNDNGFEVEGVGERTFSPNASQHSVFDFEDSIESVDQSPEAVTAQSSVVENVWTGPVVGADRIIDDIHAFASNCANAVVSNSLEMMWFVMAAADDIRPRKTAIRAFVREVLQAGVRSVEHTLDVACKVAEQTLRASYESALAKRIEEDVATARAVVAANCLNHTMRAAVNIVVSSELKEVERQVRVQKSLAQELAIDFVSTTTSKGVDAFAMRLFVTQRLALQATEASVAAAMSSLLSKVAPRMISEEAFVEMCEDAVVGPIGAALFTIDSKVMKVQRALAKAKERNRDGDVLGAIPVGAGFALAKARKSSHDMAELEIYNLDSKELVTHSFPSSKETFETVNEAVAEAVENVGDIDRVMHGQKLGTIQRVGMIIHGKSFLVRTLRTVDGIVLEALNVMSSKVISVKLTYDQEKALDNTRNPTEETRKILSESREMRGEEAGLSSTESSFHEKTSIASLSDKTHEEFEAA